MTVHAVTTSGDDVPADLITLTASGHAVVTGTPPASDSATTSGDGVATFNVSDLTSETVTLTATDQNNPSGTGLRQVSVTFVSVPFITKITPDAGPLSGRTDVVIAGAISTQRRSRSAARWHPWWRTPRHPSRWTYPAPRCLAR